LATCLIVIGVVVLFTLSSRRLSVPTSSSATSTKSELSSLAVSTDHLVLLNENSVTLLDFKGQRERLSFEQFAQRIPVTSYPIEGVEVANGARAYFNLPYSDDRTQKTDSRRHTAELPTPDGVWIARLDTPKADGASTVRISAGSRSEVKTAESRHLVLRNSKGQPLKDARLVGWFNASELMVIGRVTSTLALFALDRNDGNLRFLKRLPDSLVWIEGRGVAVWYVVASLGEGLESPPRGPSELHRVSVDGTDKLMAREAQRVFIGVIYGPRQLFAYTLDDGQSYLTTDSADSNLASARSELNQQRPLLFLPDGRLLLRQGFELTLYDSATQQRMKLGTLPEGHIEIYLNPSTKK